MYIDGNFDVGLTSDGHYVISMRVIQDKKKAANKAAPMDDYERTTEKTLVANDTNDLLDKIKVIVKAMRPDKRNLALTETEFEKTFNTIAGE